MRGIVSVLFVAIIAFSVAGCGGGGGNSTTASISYTLDIEQAPMGSNSPLISVNRTVIQGKEFAVTLVSAGDKSQPQPEGVSLTWFDNNNGKFVPQIVTSSKEDHYILAAGTYTVVADYAINGVPHQVNRTFIVQ